MGMCVDKDMNADKNLPGENTVNILVYLHVEELWWIKKKKKNNLTCVQQLKVTGVKWLASYPTGK